ncbi:MAG: hypothetical protein ABL984_13220 [Pyrinomonadaceae bacterium]
MRRTYIIVFLAVLFLGLRIEHGVLFYDLGRDKRYQMNAAGNFAAGNGLSHCITFADDIAKVTCQEVTWWSAGYPLVIGSLYKVTDDLITADFILILFGMITFLFASFRFFSLWSDDTHWAFGAFLVFAGFSFTPFNYLGTNDLLSTSFIILAISEASFGLKEHKRWGFVVAGLAAFAAAFFKFNFYPLLAIVPAGLTLLALLRRDFTLIKYVLYFLAPIATCFLVLYAVFPDHVLPPRGVWVQGWNWHNLASQDPFGTKALFFIDFLLRRLDSGSMLGFVLLGLIHAFSIAAVLGMVYASGRYAKRNYRSESCDGRTLAAVLGIVTTGTVVAYLVWLSIRLPTFHHPIYIPWTFVQETRYYAPAMVLLIFAVFILPLHVDRRNSLLRLASLTLVIAACSYAVTYWGYKNFDYFYNGRVEGSFAGPHRDDATVAEFLKNDRTLDRRTTVLGFMTHAGAYGYPILLIETDPARFPFPWYDWYVGSIPVNSSERRTLLVTIHKSPTEADRAIVDRFQGVRILELETYDLYRLEILP